MPAKVTGPTDHVVVVGAGLAGLSAALRLAGAGRKVTVVERESVPGGRNGLLEKDGYSFDTGPTVLTMPSLIQDAFSCVGEDMKDWLELMPLSPLYRAFYADGSQIDVHANTAQMEEEIRTQVSAEEALGHVRSHLQDAQKALTGTVDALTKGVSGYSTQISDLHTKMDQHLASAVNQLSGSITNLEEVLDEFIDALPPKA